MHKRRDFKIPQPARVRVTVNCQNIENTSYLLVNFLRFFPGFVVFVRGPYIWILDNNKSLLTVKREILTG